MADAASGTGLDAHPLPEGAQSKILARVPFASARNPVDVTGQVTTDHELMPLAYSLMLQEGNYDSLVVFQAAAGLSARGPELVEQACNVRAKYPDRVIALTSLFPPELHRTLDKGKVLAFADPIRAVRAVAALARFATSRPSMFSDAAVPQFDFAPGAMNEVDALACLQRAGIHVVPHRLAVDADEAAAAAVALGYPVVGKVVSPDILHKTEIGGVALNLRDRGEVVKAFQQLRARAATAHPKARVDGVLVAPMIKGGIECILGVQRDAVFGPMVMFGLGGILVEALRDVSFRLAPFDETEAHRMIDSIKARAVLDGWRGSPAADIEALANALAALSQFAFAVRERLESVDINPFVVLPRGQGAVALDAVIIARD